MSTETGAEKGSSTEIEGTTDIETNEGVSSSEESKTTTPQNANANQHEENTAVPPPSTSSSDLIPGDGSRSIIAVSANKNPTAFFQLARKFLMTNEMCDLSALEGAIVSAVDAAHLLERSKLASIVRIHTSYVNVEPKRRRQSPHQQGEVSSTTTKEGVTSTPTSEDTTNTKSESHTSSAPSSTVAESKKTTNSSESQQDSKQPAIPSSASRNSAKPSGSGGNRELRRARILVTVKRTESYERWLEENPSQRQAIIAGTAAVKTVEDSSLPPKKDGSDLRKSPPPSSTSD